MYSEYFNMLNKLDEQYLTESNELYSGIFWIVDFVIMLVAGFVLACKTKRIR